MLNCIQWVIDKIAYNFRLQVMSFLETTASYGIVVTGVNLRGIFSVSLLTLQFT